MFDFVNAVATRWQLAVYYCGSLRYGYGEQSSHKKQAHYLKERQSRLGQDELDDQQDAPRNADQGRAGFSIGHLRRFRLRAGGDLGRHA